MALKAKLTKAEYDKLSDDLKKAYKADGEEFAVDIDGAEDTGALRRALDTERKARKDADARVKTLEVDLEDASKDRNKGSEEITKVEAKWQTKLDKAVGEVTAKLTNAHTHIKKLMGDNVASEIAGKLSKSPKLMLPHIQSRIAVDLEGDEPLTVFLDKTGKPSKLSREDLEKEFVANPDFKDILIASKASGGGTPSPAAAGGGMPQDHGKPVNLGSMKGAQLAAHLAAKKEAASQNS